jgi:chromate reductase
MTNLKILGISGSNRTGSFNSRLLNLVVSKFKPLGLSANIIEATSFGLEFYSAEVEEKHGLPAAVVSLKRAFNSVDAILFATPEYNGFPPGILKNMLDWVSRRGEGEQSPCEVFSNKPVWVISTSPGKGGGARAQKFLAAQLEYLGANVQKQTVTIGGAREFFSKSGSIPADINVMIDAFVRDMRQVLSTNKLER